MKRIEHNAEGYAFPFVEYVPQDATVQLPLVIQLHGAGERGNGGEELCKVDIHGFSKILQQGEYRCRVVMPQCPADTFWVAKVESILRFVKELKEKYNPSSVYLTGLSMGGFGTWYTAMAAPSEFQAIAPVCGGCMEWNAAVLSMPVWAFHGLDDTVVSPIYTELMVKALKNTNADITYTPLEGVGHNAWDYAYTPQLLAWLLSK